MKRIIFFVIITFSISNIVICQNYNEKKVSHSKDTIDLKESVKQDDIPVNEYLINQLKPFLRISKDWIQ